MRILLSAFACDPALGSEAAVGWTWACELARQGHSVSVLTRFRYQATIEAAVAQGAAPKIDFVYFDLKYFPYKVPLFGVYAYYFFWQLKAALHANNLFKIKELDCIHHVTYASCRTFFFLSWLSVPSIFGPVGGGEGAPLRLIRTMSLKGKVHEYLRAAANSLLTLFPISELLWRKASLNLVTTDETLRLVPKRYRFKTRVLSTIASPVLQADVHTLPQPHVVQGFRMLYVGRLLEWKGVHLALEAMSRALKVVPNLSLTVLGEGNSEGRLRALTKELGLEAKVSFLPPISREGVLELYREHDVLILPSLHDSGGTVVLEAFSRGVPVICLKLGGPGVLVDPNCGAAIETEDRTIHQVVDSLSKTIVRFSQMPFDERTALQHGAIRRAQEFQIDTMVRRAYSWFEERLASTNPLQGSDHAKGRLHVGSVDSSSEV